MDRETPFPQDNENYHERQESSKIASHYQEVINPYILVKV
jgi:hypothetical protein